MESSKTNGENRSIRIPSHKCKRDISTDKILRILKLLILNSEYIQYTKRYVADAYKSNGNIVLKKLMVPLGIRPKKRLREKCRTLIKITSSIKIKVFFCVFMRIFYQNYCFITLQNLIVWVKTVDLYGEILRILGYSDTKYNCKSSEGESL